jgi:hypothetical protein
MALCLEAFLYRTEPLQRYSPSIACHNGVLRRNLQQNQFLISDRLVRQQNTDFRTPEMEALPSQS